GSDIDLALVGNDLSPKIALEIAAILNEKLPIPYHVDVLHYDSITNPELKNHIDRVGKSFFE
ncbi:MAG: nucleotidyltransferase domain-containing protein, partial [Bacteroidales bacterium]|nr:nucleotidyltransferase domain-containing protein [Bacteroidales bacterium]